MKLVIIESPFAGDVVGNIQYARRALRHALQRGEAPLASHLLYTQRGVLDDNDPGERKLGIFAGLEWRKMAELQVFYTDRGWSGGMLAALRQAQLEEREYELRALDGPVQMPSCGLGEVAAITAERLP